MLLSLVFRHLIRRGKLTIVDTVGGRHVYQGTPGPEFVMHLHDPSLYWKLFINPRLYLGEGFMEGTLTIEQASIYDFLYFIAENLNLAPYHWSVRISTGIEWVLRNWQQYNPVPRAHQNVAHHYDLSGTLYDLFLHADRNTPVPTSRRPASPSRRHKPRRSGISPRSCC